MAGQQNRNHHLQHLEELLSRMDFSRPLSEMIPDIPEGGYLQMEVYPDGHLSVMLRGDGSGELDTEFRRVDL